MTDSLDTATRRHLDAIYGTAPPYLVDGLAALLATAPAVVPAAVPSADEEPAEETAAGMPTAQTSSPAGPVASPRPNRLWDHRDVVLITYGDQLRDDDHPPIEAQRQFLLSRQLQDLIRCVHFLPFCPSTSDDGFSVADYLAVDPQLGGWDDLARMNESFDLMFDLVLNHSSQRHAWFQRFLDGDPDHAEFYVTADPAEDLRDVVRPRSLPLLTAFETATGTRHVWTTFSADQVDLNYANPKVLLAMIETLVQYARRGARIIRLDAIAFLWKQVGTNCIHLRQTHAVVQLMRHVLDRVVPGTLVLTETNVPHPENLSYFGNGRNEAHMVYQFSLPPLLLDAIHSGRTDVLRDWLDSLELPSDQTTFFNFTASHDGIGLRPVEGLLPPERIAALVEIAGRHGGRVGMRTQADGSQSPYELNITYVDAVADRQQVLPSEHARRFLATQAVMLAMRGMPAIYFHSLVGSSNDQKAVQESGIARRINRHKYTRQELDAALDDGDSLQRLVFDGYRQLLDVRCRLPALDPSVPMEVLRDIPGDGMVGFVRRPQADSESAEAGPLTVLANLSGRPRTVARTWLADDVTEDVLSGETLAPAEAIPMQPFQVRWLQPART